jgi:hypothetical protein
MRGWAASDLRVCSTAAGSLNVKPAVLLAPVIAAVVARSLMRRWRMFICSYVARATHATTSATELVTTVMSVSLRLRGR